MSFDKLKGKMTERHVSQEKLSKVLGITVQSLNAKLNGRSQFTLEEVVKISEHLKLDNPVDIFFNPSVSKMQHIIEPEEEVVYMWIAITLACFSTLMNSISLICICVSLLLKKRNDNSDDSSNSGNY